MKLLNKKSQSLSLTTVIVAALALVILIILILIFTGRISIFRQGVVDCPAGSTASTSQCSSNPAYEELPVKIGEQKGTDGTVQLVYCCKSATAASTA